MIVALPEALEGVRADIASALLAARRAKVNSPEAAHVPSIPHAPHPADLPVRVVLVAVLVSALAPALELRGLVASVVRLVRERVDLLRLAKHLVRSVTTRLRVAVDASSIPRPRKAR